MKKRGLVRAVVIACMSVAGSWAYGQDRGALAEEPMSLRKPRVPTPHLLPRSPRTPEPPSQGTPPQEHPSRRRQYGRFPHVYIYPWDYRRSSRGWDFYVFLPYGAYWYGDYYWYPYYYPVWDPRWHVVLDTPWAGAGARVLEVSPSEQERLARLGAAEGTVFESRLSTMLGGPQRVGAAFALGEAALRSGDFEEAVAAFQYARRANPDDSLVQVGLAIALMATEKYSGAAYMLRRALEGMLDWTAAQLDLAELFGGPERYETAAAQLTKAAGADPSSQDLQLLLGFHYFGTRQYAKAATVLLALHEAAPSQVGVKRLLGAAEARLGTEAKATEGEALPAGGAGGAGTAKPGGAGIQGESVQGPAASGKASADSAQGSPE